MNKAAKIWLIIAAVFVILGLVIFLGVMVAYELDFSKFSTEKYTTNKYEISEDFDKIFIDVDTTDVEFAPSEDGQCVIVYTETEKIKHSAQVLDSGLNINVIDARKWYDHIGIFSDSLKMTVYLPQESYASLFINTDTGDITIPKDFSFENLKIEGDTADTECYASVSGVMEIELSTGDIKVDGVNAGDVNFTTDTGDININSLTAKGDIEIETDTGEVSFADVSGASLTAEIDTGDMLLKDTIAVGGFFIESDTGDVIFKNCDAAELFVESDTGDVKGSLLTDKVFITESDTGRVNVPKTVTGGKCEIITNTGDIEIVIAQ